MSFLKQYVEKAVEFRAVIVMLLERDSAVKCGVVDLSLVFCLIGCKEFCFPLSLSQKAFQSLESIIDLWMFFLINSCKEKAKFIEQQATAQVQEHFMLLPGNGFDHEADNAGIAVVFHLFFITPSMF